MTKSSAANKDREYFHFNDDEKCLEEKLELPLPNRGDVHAVSILIVSKYIFMVFLQMQKEQKLC